MISKKWLGLGLVGLLGMSGVGLAQDPPPRPVPPPAPVRPDAPQPRGGMNQDSALQAARELAEMDKAIRECMAAGDKEKVRALEERKTQTMARLMEMLNEQRAPRRVEMPPQHQEEQLALQREFQRLQDELKVREAKGEPAPKDLLDRYNNMRARLQDFDALRTRDRNDFFPDVPVMSPEELKRHQETMKLEREAGELGGQLRRTPADKKEEREEIRAKMAKVVAQLFDARETSRAREVDELKRRIDEVTKLLQKRKESRDKIIERKIKQLSGEPDELDW